MKPLKLIVMKERIRGNTVYSVGFNSEHKEPTDNHTMLDVSP